MAPVQRAAGSAGEMNFGVNSSGGTESGVVQHLGLLGLDLPRVASMPQMQEPDGHYEDTLYNGR